VTFYDIFNGDADGIAALHQLRLHEPRDSQLVTGLKRDIHLFRYIEPKAGDRIVALDISFDKNREGVRRALQAGAEVFYADHHYAGDLIDAPGLDLHVHTDADTCTSLIVNGLLRDAWFPWALVGLYGDNLHGTAEKLGQRKGVSPAEREDLKLLGTCLNYNGYGFELNDLVYHPAELYQRIKPFENPLDFMQTADFGKLLRAYEEDLDAAAQVQPVEARPDAALYLLPDELWSRRVNGVFSNDLARLHPDRAHAVLTPCGRGCYRVSVRAPLNRKTGADRLCREFPGGGGREAAAGINELSQQSLEHFKRRFFEFFRSS
jgi:hypothetical protein